MSNKLSAFSYFGEVPERPKGADCKSAGTAFGGSNPPLSTSRAGFKLNILAGKR